MLVQLTFDATEVPSARGKDKEIASQQIIRFCQFRPLSFDLDLRSFLSKIFNEGIDDMFGVAAGGGVDDVK
jgi:hypothetical protein